MKFGSSREPLRQWLPLCLDLAFPLQARSLWAAVGFGGAIVQSNLNAVIAAARYILVGLGLIGSMTADARGINHCLDVGLGYSERFQKALDRAGPKNCEAYAEAISLEKKTIQQLRSCLSGAQPGRQADLVAKAIETAERATKLAQTAAGQDGCGGPPSAQPDDAQVCEKESGDVAIAACTRAIASQRYTGHDLAVQYNNRCVEYANKRDNDRAITDCSEAIHLDPKYAEPFNTRGIAYNAKGDYDHAVADYSEAIRLNPNHTKAFNNRGNTYRAKGDLDRAVADYDRAIGLDQQFALAYNNRGNAYRAKGNLDAAIADYTAAIRINPRPQSDNNINVYNNRGLAYQDKADFDRAIADYFEAIRLDPKYANAFNNRGSAYRANGELERAIADYSEAIRLDPKYSFAFTNRGITELYGGQLAKALADLDQANELNPKYGYAALWLDIVGKRNNLPSRLSETSKQIDMTKWPAQIIRLYLGRLTPEAVLASAGDSDPNTKTGQICETNFYSGELSLQRDAKDEAARLFQLAVADCPKNFVEWFAANAELKVLGRQP